MKQVTRAELYELVWANPVTKVAPQFGISDVAFRKACIAADVPLPPAGYWAKLRAGKAGRRPALPPRSLGLDDIRFVGAGYHDAYWRLSREERLAPPPAPPAFSGTIEDMEALARSVIGKAKLIRSLDRPHHVIAKQLEADDHRREKMRTAFYTFPWEKPLFDFPFEKRRLRILNSLLMATAKAGGRPSITAGGALETTIRFHDYLVGLRLDTPENLRKDSRYERREPVEGGKPRLRVIIPMMPGATEERWAWEDTADDQVEAHLDTIAARLLIAADLQLREYWQRHHEWRVQERERLLEEERLAKERSEREERERQEQLARERVECLLDEAEALKNAETIRGYVARVRQLASERGHDAASIESWAAWALSVADRLDPVRTGAFMVHHEPEPEAEPISRTSSDLMLTR